MPRRSPRPFHRQLFAVAALALAAGASPLAAQEKGAPANAPFMNPALPVPVRVQDLISRMTLEEKASQMRDQAPAIPRLGVPAYGWWNEAAHGVANNGYATNFPTTLGLGATWDTPLVHKVGDVVGTEGRAKYHEDIRNDVHERFHGLTFWAPNINIFRDPRWGRGQETYGEDPFLTGRMAVAFVTGVQGDDPKYLKAISTPKHYAVHSGPEPLRHRFNVNVTPHDLEDTYLPAFRAAVVEGHAGSVMCAYNAIDNAPACASSMLLQDYLREYWGFDGYVTSDCGAIGDVTTGHHWTEDGMHGAVASVKAGTELNCAGSEYSTLPEAVKQGLITEAQIDTALARLFTARFKLGMFDPPESYAYGRIPLSANISPENRQLARQAEREAIVLLKNDGLLPLKGGQKIAVIGPTAELVQAIQGNYNGTPKNPVSPLAGLVKRFGVGKVSSAQGSTLAEGLAIPVERSALHTGKAEGLKGEYFASADFSGKPLLVRVDPLLNFNWSNAVPIDGLKRDSYSIRWTGTIAAPAAGDYRLNLSAGRGFGRGGRDTVRLWIDGQLLYDNSKFAMPAFGPPGRAPAPGQPPAPGAPPAAPITPGNPTGAAQGPITPGNPTGAPAGGFRRFTIPDTVFHFADTKPHDIKVELRHHAGSASADLTWQPPAGVLQAEAVKTAQQADVVVAVMGLSPQLEGEEMPVSYEGFKGGDRTDIVLPRPQRELLAALKATGKPIVLVLTSGSALTVDDKLANAILAAWYPGEEGGNAIAETLAGENNPAGRLPVTLYASVDQLPPFEDYSMANRTYRYFTGKPWHGFGFGLSYTTFAYSGLKVPQSIASGDSAVVEVDVKNTGKVAGDEVVELYLTQPKSSLTPLRTLGAFKRVHVAPGQTVHVALPVSVRTIGQVMASGDRVIVPGTYQVYVGGTQPGESEGGVTGTLTVTGLEKTLPK